MLVVGTDLDEYLVERLDGLLELFCVADARRVSCVCRCVCGGDVDLRSITS